MRSTPLASHHVHRAELVATVLSSPLTAVVAGGGFGKSSLAIEVADTVPAALVVALPAACEPKELTATVARAARLQGDDELSDRLAMATEDPADALVAAFLASPEGRVLILDDIEHAAPDTAAMIVAVGRVVTSPHHLILVGRALPPGAEGLDRLPQLRHITADDLALTPGQVASLARAGFDLDLDEDEVAALHDTTGGWAAATVMVCSRAADGGLDLVAAGTHDVLDVLVNRLRNHLNDADRHAAAQLAHLPLFDDALVEASIGSDALRRLLAAGLALTTIGGGWRRLAGPLQERMVTWGALDTEMARTAAEHYARRGLAVEAARLLVAGDLDHEAVQLLREAADLGGVHATDLLEAIDTLGPTLARHPDLWLVRARALLDLWWFEDRTVALERLAGLLAETPDPALELALAAERALDLAWAAARSAEAVQIAERVLNSGRELEPVTRLHALEALGRGLAFEPDPDARRRARQALEQARAISIELGSSHRQAMSTIAYAKMILFPAGDATTLLAAYDEVVPLTRPKSWLRGILQIYRIEALLDLGESAALDAAFDEAERIGHRLADRRILSHVSWLRAMQACQTGDAPATLRLLREAEWKMPEGMDRKIRILLYRDAAEQCLKIGRPDLSRRYLRRLDDIDRVDGEGAGYLHQARAFYDALHGDAAAAIAALDRLDDQHPNTRESWRRHLHRAAAFERQGDHRAAVEAATAFDIANRLGGEQLAAWREPRLAPRMLPLAEAAATVGAFAERPARAAVVVQALGSFRVTIDGEDATPPPGRSTDLLHLLIAKGGSTTGASVTAELWPDSAHDQGLHSLRNALYRLPHRERLVERQGPRLEIRGDVGLDARRFRETALHIKRQLGTDADVAIAATHRLLASYVGPLLPGVTLPSVEHARDELDWMATDLADEAARAARRLGRTVDAEALLRRGIRIGPDNEGRRLALASLLIETGRKVDARNVLADLRSHAEELGLQPGPAALKLEQRLEPSP